MARETEEVQNANLRATTRFRYVGATDAEIQARVETIEQQGRLLFVEKVTLNTMLAERAAAAEAESAKANANLCGEPEIVGDRVRIPDQEA